MRQVEGYTHKNPHSIKDHLEFEKELKKILFRVLLQVGFATIEVWKSG